MPISRRSPSAASGALLRAQKPEAVALMDPGLVEMCRRGEAVTQEQYVEAVAQRAALGQRLRLFFDRYDLLSPTMPIPAAYADPRTDELPNPSNAWSWVAYTYAFNLTKNPSCSIPCGFSDGLPIGLMVTGPLYEDLGVLRACRAYSRKVEFCSGSSTSSSAEEGSPWMPRPSLSIIRPAS